VGLKTKGNLQQLRLQRTIKENSSCGCDGRKHGQTDMLPSFASNGRISLAKFQPIHQIFQEFYNQNNFVQLVPVLLKLLMTKTIDYTEFSKHAMAPSLKSMGLHKSAHHVIFSLKI